MKPNHDAEALELEAMEKFSHFDNVSQVVEALHGTNHTIFDAKYFFLWAADHFPADTESIQSWLNNAYFAPVLLEMMNCTLSKRKEIEFASAMYEMVQLLSKISSTETDLAGFV